MASVKEEADGLDLMDDPLEDFNQTDSDNDLDDFPGDDERDDDEGHLTDEHEDPHHSFTPSPLGDLDVPVVKKAPRKKRKRSATALRKNPDAPRRFKSSYIFFFTAKQGLIKERLGGKATVREISQGAAQMWKTMDTEERARWDDIAAKDKERYMKEKASYTGPWQVPHKRPKKDPSAPKRPMSAFLLFSQGRRAKVRNEHPEMKNTEVSRILGEMWRTCTDEQKKPFQDEEKALRERYKVEMEGWKEKADERKEAAMKRKKEDMERQKQQHNYAVQIAQSYVQTPQHHGGIQQTNFYGQSIGYTNHQLYPQGHPAMYQQVGYSSQYAYSQPNGYQYQVAGKQQRVVLASNGMPYYPSDQQQMQKQMEHRSTNSQQGQSYATTLAPTPSDASFGTGFLDLDS